MHTEEGPDLVLLLLLLLVVAVGQSESDDAVFLAWYAKAWLAPIALMNGMVVSCTP
jgi:hypothetical protein